ncbi:2',3'-cyclic-nucleotide 3'-phosphodiesterase [Trichomycterus rosablanca]|uniref:2',3'-cyclic-nucleotide 3'-phosphodiesterase n=1 Tax=Trichomycterus rosablanca TaxID=2290929 RepID=UPI002F3581C3
MEADQNQQEPEAVAQTEAAETPEQPKSEGVNETPSPPPEPEKPAVEASEPETESTEKTAKVEPDDEKPETSEEPVKLPEKEEEPEEVPKTAVETENEVVQQAVEPEKKPENDEPEKKPENDEKPSVPSEEKGEPEEPGKTEPAAPEPAAPEPAAPEPAAPEPAAPNEVPAEPVKEEEKAEAPKTETEEKQEKPAEEEQVQAEPPKEVAAQPKEEALPLFYGWFLLSDVKERIRCSTMDFLKTLDTLEVFKKHINEFTGEADKEVDLEQYFQTPETLHCTTKFCDYGEAEGAKEYAEQQVVKDSYDTATELSVVGLIVTPRTFGARVTLTPEQMPLWGAGADIEGVPATELPAVEALPAGSRAHVTLGCAPDVEPVRTGLDLLDILVVLQEEKEVVAVEELELGTLSYLGQGRWYLSLREAVTCDATYSSFSEKERLAGPAKKEGGEKKKKQKCVIL